MDSSASSSIGSGEIQYQPPSHNSPLKWKKYGFAIAIIAGIGLLAVGSVGPFSHLSQAAVMSMVVVGGVGGTSLLLTGIAGSVKVRNQEKKIEAEKSAFINNTAVGQIRGDHRFGKDAWKKYFGEVGEEPPLPKDLEKILNSPCPFSGDEKVKVKDTHMLVLIPKTIDGKALTLNKLEELIKNPKEGHATQFKPRFEYHKADYRSKEVDRSYWVLMTRDEIPGSKRKNFRQAVQPIVPQRNFLNSFGNVYMLPNALEAAVCILTEYVGSGKKLFGKTHIHCSDFAHERANVTVGLFDFTGTIYAGNDKSRRLKIGLKIDSQGLDINGYLSPYDNQVGLAAIRRF